MPEQNTVVSSTRRNYFVSYLKGIAISAIIVIHLLDWSNKTLTISQIQIKQWLYPGVLFFIALSGAVIYIAYAKYESMAKITAKLWYRGWQLIGIYFLYNVIKLYIFNFHTEPFYGQFYNWGKSDLLHVLSLKSFTAPITIILTIGVFLLVSPILMYIAKKRRFGRKIILLLIAINILLAYGTILPVNRFTDFLLAKNNVMFPLLLWSVPYLIGFYLGQIGLEKRKYLLFILFTALYLIIGRIQGEMVSYMYPLRLSYVFFSFALMYGLIIILSWIKKMSVKYGRWFLGWLNVLGDNTLSVYIVHWIIIDLTIWIFYPQVKYIWWSVAAYILLFTYLKRRNISTHLRA